MEHAGLAFVKSARSKLRRDRHLFKEKEAKTHPAHLLNPVGSVTPLRPAVGATPSLRQNRGAFPGNLTNKRLSAGAGHVRYAAPAHPPKALG
jgi:hypothetical protein